MPTEPLAAVVCGIPFSGTTLTSRIICAHPFIDSGFECGLLFGDNPSEFIFKANKFYNWMMSHEPPYNWKLTKSQMDDITKSDGFYEAYAKIIKHCELFQKEKKYVLDKTPAYIYKLKQKMQLVPNTPFIIVVKEPMSQYYSFKKRDLSLNDFVDAYSKFSKSKQEILSDNNLSSRLIVLNYGYVNQYPGRTYRKIINFLNKFNTEIRFNKNQIPLLNKQLKSDIRNQKKLRPKFDYEEEKKKFSKLITKNEFMTIERLFNNNTNFEL